MTGSWDVESPSDDGAGEWGRPRGSGSSGSSSATVDVRSSLDVSSAPVSWLYLGIGAPALGLLLRLTTDSPRVAIGGWFLGGTVSILLLAVFISVDLRRRAVGFARDSAAVPWLRPLLVVLAVAAVAVNAWTIADALARRSW